MEHLLPPSLEPNRNFQGKSLFFGDRECKRDLLLYLMFLLQEEVKKRLRMVLVADRCGMSPASLSEMKKTIISALQVGFEPSVATSAPLPYHICFPLRNL
jgi:hypothetical protein